MASFGTGEAARPVDPEERIDLLFRHLATSRTGFSEREAARRLEQHGPNEIRRRQGPSHSAVARAEPAGAAPVGEDHKTTGRRR